MEMLYSTHNPHSFKSELLRTLVLSLVASHSPEQLNLVLVDFKGGATFIGMEQLPHVAAVITNLDDESALVDRMEDALQGSSLGVKNSFVPTACRHRWNTPRCDVNNLPMALVMTVIICLCRRSSSLLMSSRNY
ncbi:FtsK/SpoIIIE domain-containing protein [Corynebacterium kroppenstedtii]|nr:FtsK/SpoIIIE domain-containing protein [Corynebacterium kroppenstedtii]MDN8624157.1 FtsK/SpoIIIE domain-containing protein [Corynebacterium kroppenstedtii]